VEESEDSIGLLTPVLCDLVIGYLVDVHFLI